MRVFVALPVPPHVRDGLGRAIAPLVDAAPHLRWSRPDGWHVTLAFLGHLDDHLLPDVVEVVARSVDAAVRDAQAPRRLRLGAPGRFGDRVLWAGVDADPTAAVATLGTLLQTALADAGLPVDLRPVRPHLTLARTRGTRSAPRVDDGMVAEVEVPALGWDVTEVAVCSSHLGRGHPAHYVVEGSVEVAG